MEDINNTLFEQGEKCRGPMCDQDRTDPAGGVRSEPSRLKVMVEQLWELRERDAQAVAELSARLARFEAAFAAHWSVSRRLEVQALDLTRKIRSHDAAIDLLSGLVENPRVRDRDPHAAAAPTDASETEAAAKNTAKPDPASGTQTHP